MNYAFTDGEVVFITDVFKAMSLENQEVVSLEIDRLVEDHCEGWSVVASGSCPVVLRIQKKPNGLRPLG